MLVLNRMVDKNVFVKFFFLTEDPVFLRVSPNKNESAALRYIYVPMSCRLDVYLLGGKKKRQLIKHPQENYCKWITAYSIFYLQLLRNQIIVLQLGSSAD